MSTINRYIARLYLINIVTLLVLLFCFVMTVDVFTNLSRFSNAAVDRIEEAGGANGDSLHRTLLTVLLVFDLWGPRLLQLFNYVIGLVLVGAMGFTCAQLVRHREFVALLASGVSLQRLARPFLVVALFFAAIQVVNQEVFVPAVAHLLTRDAGDSGRRSVANFRVRLAPDDQGRFFSARRFIDESQTMQQLRIWEREDGVIRREVIAEQATWDGGAWVLEGGVLIDHERSTRGVIERVETSLDPTRLKVRYLEGFGQSLGWRQISQILAHGGVDEAARERLQRLRWGRVAGVFSNVITMLATLPFFLTRLPRPMLSASLKAAPIAVAGLVAAAAAPTLAVPGLPVALAAFVPTLLLLPLAIALFSGIRS
jgi:lipopolysaccharide export system permease protein